MSNLYNLKNHIFVFTILVWASSVPVTSAQVTLDDLPNREGNTRFATNAVIEVDHPSLSLNGFDCGTPCDGDGYGLKQILEQVPGLGSESSIREVYDDLVDLHDNPIETNPSSRGQVDENVRIMQARAFVALSTYVLEQNSDNIAGLPTHSTAVGRLKDALLDFDAWKFDGTLTEGDDAVKWAGPLSGLARTLDLYLALENAYCYYGAAGDSGSQNECIGATSNYLLSVTEKASVFDLHFEETIVQVNHLGGAGWAPGLNGFDAQPGNHPLKVQTAIGLASMVMNDMGDVSTAAYRDYV